MNRQALVIVLDSVGIGDAPDAAEYGDQGANTLGHLLDRYPELRLPALWSLGLGRIVGRGPAVYPRASYGTMRERSAGKDSTTGHWELAGVKLESPFGLFDHFPEALVSAIEREAGVRFIGNLPASGTQIIEDLGPQHLQTGRPILYTSADSVLQIAAHEEILPIERLYEICRIARKHADAYRVGRVIARPFVGSPGQFKRTERRHDFSMLPPRTVLDALIENGQSVRAVGKIGDLFAGQGITENHPTGSNAQGMEQAARLWSKTEKGLVFVNLVDFDTLFGHRRNPAGYAAALVEFDHWLADFLPQVRSEDLLIVTADHGNDPTYHGTDHTRERVPVMVKYQERCDDLGERDTFADVAATLADYFQILSPSAGGTSLLKSPDGQYRHDTGPPLAPRAGTQGGIYSTREKKLPHSAAE